MRLWKENPVTVFSAAQVRFGDRDVKYASGWCQSGDDTAQNSSLRLKQASKCQRRLARTQVEGSGRRRVCADGDSGNTLLSDQMRERGGIGWKARLYHVIYTVKYTHVKKHEAKDLFQTMAEPK